MLSSIERNEFKEATEQGYKELVPKAKERLLIAEVKEQMDKLLQKGGYNSLAKEGLVVTELLHSPEGFCYAIKHNGEEVGKIEYKEVDYKASNGFKGVVFSIKGNNGELKDFLTEKEAGNVEDFIGQVFNILRDQVETFNQNKSQAATA